MFANENNKDMAKINDAVKGYKKYEIKVFVTSSVDIKA